jgi:uncharacterized protein (DUF305 family)
MVHRAAGSGMPSTRFAPILVAVACAAAPLTAQDHAGHDMGAMTGLPDLKPIPAGANVTVADVHFMQGMIAHHAQAIYMSHLAARHGADPRFLRFAIKIDQSQTAEIRLMRGWLVDHGQVAPDTSAYHTIMMPGMLTPEQLGELSSLQGTGFDRRFLELMIMHHEGALSMVADLFATPGAGQEVDISVLANDIHSVQTAEIGLMRQMLANLEETR